VTHKERQLAAIRHEETDRISVDAICIENLSEIAKYLGMSDDGNAVLDRLGIDGRIVSVWQQYLGELPIAADGTRLTEWGTETEEDYGTNHHYPLANASSVADVDNYNWPNPALYDFADAARLAEEFSKKYAVRGPCWKPLFCRVCEMMGMEEAMVKMAVEPAVFEAAIEQVFQYVYSYSKSMLDTCGDTLDIYSIGDDFATQRGMLISPEQWRKFLKPRYAALFAMAKERGKPIWFHSCGDVTAVLPDLIDIGVDVWETVQLHTLPMRPEELKREYGSHLTFFGGVNTQRLPFISPPEVREETLHCIKVLGKGGGYICGPDHHIKPDVPPANTLALFDTATSQKG
jgi:uroporphyrinogen decarboxylase